MFYKKNNAFRGNASVLLLLLPAAILSLLLIAKSVSSSQKYQVLGTYTLLAKGGDDSGESHSGSGGDGDSSGSSNSGSGSSGSGSSGSQESESSGGSSGSGGGESSGSSVSSSTKVLCTGPDGKQFETEFKDCQELNKTWNNSVRYSVLNKTEVKTKTAEKTEPKEVEVETKTSEENRVRLKTKDGKTTLEVTQNGIKTKLVSEDGKLTVKAEKEDGTEVELEDESFKEVENHLAEDNISVSTESGQLVIQKNNTRATTTLPLSVDLGTNTLSVDTPSGVKTLAVLPDQAVQNLIDAGIINRVSGTVNQATGETETEKLQVEDRNGVLVYEVKGISDQRLFGLIPLKISKDISVSTETGNAVVINQSLVSRLLDILSI